MGVRPSGRAPLPKLLVTEDRIGGRFDVPRKALVQFSNVTFTNVDFGHAKFEMFIASGARFSQCDFRSVRFSAGQLGNTSQTTYSDCRFDRAELAGIDPLYARFERCSFDGADLTGWRAFNAEFVQCHFSGRIVEAKFSGRLMPSAAAVIQPKRVRNEFRANDFRQATLVDCSFFDGIDLREQFLPEGPEYVLVDDVVARISAARAKIAKWPDHTAREQALLMLRVLKPETRGQDQLFARRDDIPAPKLVRDRVWDLLARAD